MNRSKLKTYAPQARRDFIQAVTDRAAVYGLTPNKIEVITEKGDVAIIGGKPFQISVADKRRRLEEQIKRHGFDHVMEAMAYTWFNRLVAIRYMELHGYLDHGYRVLSNADATKSSPEVVEHAEHVDLPGLDKQKVVALKLDGTKESELYQMLLLAQCHALQKAMPFLFERIDDETELLLPDNLLHSDSIIRKLVNEIEEADWQQVEIIGWLYQFYISERKNEVIGSVVKSEDIPAATQLFTPNWIVKYLVQNSLGRQWLATYPQSLLKTKMEFYVEPAEQTPEVQAQLKTITPNSLNPEELTLMDPACGSGHILVEAYDLLKEIYLERGYRLRDIPKLILTKNVFGLEIDDRAAQLAAFALMMKARADDRHIFDGDVRPDVIAIQESNGLNMNSIVQAFTEKKITSESDLVAGEFGFMGAVRAPLFATANQASATVDDKLAADLKAILAIFENAKTFGSLIRVPEELVKRLPVLADAVRALQADPNLSVVRVAERVGMFLSQALLLSGSFDAVIANPPYMGSRGMNTLLKGFVEGQYPEGKSDLFAAFIQRASTFQKPYGRSALVTMQSWMFLASYENLRQWLVTQSTLQCMVHMSNGVMGIAFGTAAAIWQQKPVARFRASFSYMGSESLGENGIPASFPIKDDRCCSVCVDDSACLPGMPLAYWISPKLLRIFQIGIPLSEIGKATLGMNSTNNILFVRAWHEVALSKVGFGFGSGEEAATSDYKWFPYNKGGPFRKWYGNREWVINWHKNGFDIHTYNGLPLDFRGAPVRSKQYQFRESLTWSFVSSSYFGVRYSPPGSLFDVGGSSYFTDAEHIWTVIAFLCSTLAVRMLEIVNPTLNLQAGNIGSLRMPKPPSTDWKKAVESNAMECVALSESEWNEREVSWSFSRHPLLINKAEFSIASSTEKWAAAAIHRRERVRQLEEANNRLFSSAGGVDDEILPTILDDQVTLVEPTRSDAVLSLISNSIGCAMGRYSLDKLGLIYANSGNEGFDPSQYITFPADKDGIIPVTQTDWFTDAAAYRFEEFVGVAWPKEHLEENLTFVADSLGPKGDERPRDTIRRYFANEFYKHHLQTYKRRPIYWLFTSGKLGAFECLVYLHRYNEGTLARMRTEYVIPLQGKINARIDQLEGDKSEAASTAHRRRLEKEQDLLKKHQIELQKFDEQLRHYADMRIKLDLDDGVKVNYAKFGDLLACVTQVCGKGEDDE